MTSEALPRSYERDDKFYFPDGDMFLAAEGVVFKVHKVMLSRDGSMFHNMFSMPNASSEQTSEDNPLVLQDNAKCFRSLLWILYALPPEITAATSDVTSDNIYRLIDCLKLANKYHFSAIQSWTSETLSSILACLLKDNDKEQQSESRAIRRNTRDILVRLSEVVINATDAGSVRLTSDLRTVWRCVIKKADTLQELVGILRILEEHDFRGLQGLAYHRILAKWPSWRKSSLLNRDQKIKLLAGYHSLQDTSYSASLLNELSAFQHSARCRNQEECSDSWDTFTTRLGSRRSHYPGTGYATRSSSGPIDIVKHLRIVCNVSNNLTEHRDKDLCFDMKDECIKNARLQAEAVLLKVETNLIDVFTL
ncbi:hypothetical protein CVT24_008201 [Panaeolus cyanescens]|uniref:BTB domain-containing protein n=1 Tax=Panaeolus cyanescens TaxID=181874 RepID=A0A409VF04_9AGAR|nr:hypothetical protein CVT24_008201 [Panaeolus cyanescens]